MLHDNADRSRLKTTGNNGRGVVQRKQILNLSVSFFDGELQELCFCIIKGEKTMHKLQEVLKHNSHAHNIHTHGNTLTSSSSL